MPRLLWVIHGTTFGGAHNEALQLNRPLRRAGWDLEVVMPEGPGNAADRLRDGGVTVVRIPLQNLRASMNPFVQARFVASLPAEISSLRGLIREQRFDLVQVNGPANPQGALAARREGAAVVWHLLDTRMPMALRRVAMLLVTHLSDCVTSVGEEVARVHPGTASLGKRLFVVAPPVDTRAFAPDPQLRAAARRELGVGPDETLVGTVGNLNEQKGHEWLIRAFRIAREASPELKLRILGAPAPGHERYGVLLRREAESAGLDAKELFVNPGARVATLMPALDVFVLSSVRRSEGIPTVVLEAMSCGLPVVATAVGSVHEAVLDGETGVIVPPEDAGALAAAINRLAAEPVARSELGAKGRARAVAEFDLERCAEFRLRAYQAALDHRRSRRPPA